MDPPPSMVVQEKYSPESTEVQEPHPPESTMIQEPHPAPSTVAQETHPAVPTMVQEPHPAPSTVAQETYPPESTMAEETHETHPPQSTMIQEACPPVPTEVQEPQAPPSTMVQEPQPPPSTLAQTTKHTAFDPPAITALPARTSSTLRPEHASGLELLASYSKIPPQEIASHLTNIQQAAFKICPYPCITLFRFLLCFLPQHSIYAEILSRLKAGASYLDIGCCFAQDIRYLAHDGAPMAKCVGVDLDARFFDLGYDLFHDRGRLGAEFMRVDIFDEEDEAWGILGGKMDIIHVANFFHLFNLDNQRLIAKRICTLVNPVKDSLVLGNHVGAAGEAEHIYLGSEAEWAFCHSAVSMQELWDAAGREVGLEAKGLRWRVEVEDRGLVEELRVGFMANRKVTVLGWVARLVETEGG